jgi:futalosine hydrolase
MTRKPTATILSHDYRLIVLLIAATERELVGLDGFVCGVGPIESALATAGRLAEGAPGAVLHVGIAGATKVDAPALVLGSAAIYSDVIDPASVLPRVDRLEPDAALLAAARKALPEAHVLPIATSGKVGGGSGADVEAMEGFGVLRACALAGVPAVELRAVSNAVNESDRSRWLIDEALELLARAIPRVLEVLDA